MVCNLYYLCDIRICFIVWLCFKVFFLFLKYFIDKLVNFVRVEMFIYIGIIYLW